MEHTEVIERLEKAGHLLPPVPNAVGLYVPAVRSGHLVFTSGQLPMFEGRLLAPGLVGAEVDAEEAARCARQAALNALAAAAGVCDLASVTRVVKLVGYVASSEGFVAQPAVVNAASEVMLVAFAEEGRHAREAVGVRRLPMDAPVEISIVLEVEA
jgi:enamine deaminase RidA (YjgF/YER057c/UK114 family)